MTMIRSTTALIFFPFLLVLFVSNSTALTGTHCDTCYRHSKAAFFASTNISTLTSGACCGYGADALRYYGSHLAASAPSIYNDGVYCGACYQVRCMNKDLCSKKGTQVVVTDQYQTKDNTTDFVLSRRAYRAMANSGMDRKLLKHGLVDIEYKRIPCEYKNRNMTLRIDKSSNSNYLGFTVLLQGGQTQILIMEIAQEAEGWKWMSMTRDHGAVWYTKEVPNNGPLMMRLRIMQGFDAKTVYAYKALPAQWKPETIYTTDLQINDIDIAACYPCEDSRFD